MTILPRLCTALPVDLPVVRPSQFSTTARLLSLAAPATEMAVREMVDAVRDRLQEAGIEDDARGSVTLAVGEALNNIVEHAYAGQAPGMVHLTIGQQDTSLCVILEDVGKPMPGGVLPAAHLPDASGPIEALPEGGFGWYIIHELCNAITYNHNAGKNTLSMHFNLPLLPQHATKP